MTHIEFFKQLNSGEISNIYLFSGKEEYIRSTALNKLKEKVTDASGIDTSVLYNPSAEEICACCETIPFLSQKRLVVIYESSFLIKGESKDEELLLNYISAPTASTVLVFISPTPDKRRKVYKALQPFETEFCEISHGELVRWIAKTLGGLGVSISAQNAEFLASYAAAKPDALICELQKLASFVKSGEVRQEDITAIVTPNAEYNVFKMVDAIVLKNEEPALKMLGRMLMQREEPLYILGAISKQFRQLLLIKTMLEQKQERSKIAAALGIRDFIFSKMAQTCQKKSREDLENAVDKCFEVDRGLKTGTEYPEIALHKLIIELCS